MKTKQVLSYNGLVKFISFKLYSLSKDYVLCTQLYSFESNKKKK